MRVVSTSRKDYYLHFFTTIGILTPMEDTNYNFWGLIVVPVGLLICFGVALLVWLREEISAGPEDE